MARLGFKYEERKKCYYVDNHESDENVNYRRKILKRYFQYGIRAHCWIQLPLNEGKKLEEKGALSIKNGHSYHVIHEQDEEFIFL